MGYNTVAVIYNDHHGGAYRSLEQMDHAIQGWTARDRDPQITYFGFGKVISQAHADDDQVVIVGRNDGVTAREASNLSSYALDQMRDCLERHGFRVSKRARKVRP